MEDQVDAIFLDTFLVHFPCHKTHDQWPRCETHLGRQRHAAADQETRLGLSRGHHAELAAVDEVDEVFDFLLDRHIVIVILGLVRIGRLRAGVGVGERFTGHRDEIDREEAWSRLRGCDESGS